MSSDAIGFSAEIVVVTVEVEVVPGSVMVVVTSGPTSVVVEIEDWVTVKVVEASVSVRVVDAFVNVSVVAASVSVKSRGRLRYRQSGRSAAYAARRYIGACLRDRTRRRSVRHSDDLTAARRDRAV